MESLGDVNGLFRNAQTQNPVVQGTQYFADTGTNSTARDMNISRSGTALSVVSPGNLNLSTGTNGRLQVAGVSKFEWSTGLFRSLSDNVDTLGDSAHRWSVVYAGTGTINTSDETEKQQIAPIDAAVLRAWARVEYYTFKFNDSVERKGDANARLHVGVMAQRVKAAFEAEGLNAFAYGLLCYDEWPEQPEERDEEGNVVLPFRAAGNRYGIRYEEALALECAYLRSRLGA
jgi:hypothetical protein